MDQNIFNQSGHSIYFYGDLPCGASEIQLSLALLQLSPALEKLYVSFKTK